MATANISDSIKLQTIEELKKSFEMELETVVNYLAASVNPDGVIAEEIKEALAKDVSEELGHAQLLARRIKQLGGLTPCSDVLPFGESALAEGKATDVESVVRGAIADEVAAIEQYRRIIDSTDGHDPVTQDLCVKLLADEEEHRTKFEEFLVEFTNN